MSTGLGIAGLGCVLLVGFVALSSVLVCGGFGSAIVSSLPTVVEVEPPRMVPGTPAAPQVEVEPDPDPVPRSRPRPRPRPVSTDAPSTPTEKPVEEPEVPAVANIAVVGDATAVVAHSRDGTARPLPGALPRGAYDLIVTFEGREAFTAGTITVIDGGSRTVQCKASLGICKVR